MANPATADLVPITREFLRNYYASYEVPVLDGAFATGAMILNMSLLQVQVQSAAAPAIVAALTRPHASKIEETMFRCREQCELLNEAVAKASTGNPALTAAAAKCMHVAELMEKFQLANTARVTKIVQDFLPQDFRGSMVQYQNKRSEASRKAEMEKLLQGGGTVADKYQLLWGHQMKRRETLAAIGNASGLWKALVKFIAGVPSSLLNFVKTINDPEGPIEEMRLKFAPNLYQIRKALNEIHIAICIILADPSAAPALLSSVTSTCDALPATVASYLKYLEQVMFTAPFFVTASQLAAQSSGNSSGDGKVRTTVDAGKTFDAEFDLDANTIIAWEFVTTNGKDISFGVFEGDKALVPNTRHDAHKAAVKGQVGPFKADTCVVLRWDNTYSYLSGKDIEYTISFLDHTGAKRASMCTSPAAGGGAAASP
jgi:hypothetical protein